jgi:bacterioferritin (cytochrome b1)
MSGPSNGRPGPVNRQRAEGVRERLAHRRQTHDYWLRRELEAELRDGEEVHPDDYDD